MLPCTLPSDQQNSTSKNIITNSVHPISEHNVHTPQDSVPYKVIDGNLEVIRLVEDIEQLERNDVHCPEMPWHSLRTCSLLQPVCYQSKPRTGAYPTTHWTQKIAGCCTVQVSRSHRPIVEVNWRVKQTSSFYVVRTLSTWIIWGGVYSMISMTRNISGDGGMDECLHSFKEWDSSSWWIVTSVACALCSQFRPRPAIVRSNRFPAGIL